VQPPPAKLRLRFARGLVACIARDVKTLPLSLRRASAVALLLSASCRAEDSGGDCGAATLGRSFQAIGCGRSRKNATPITPTLSGRPVRAAYESGNSVK
jgi:hypothetical protein